MRNFWLPLLVTPIVLVAFQNCGQGFNQTSSETLSSLDQSQNSNNPGSGTGGTGGSGGTTGTVVTGVTPTPTPTPVATPPPVVLKNQWLAMTTSGAPTPRTLGTSVWTGTKMIVFGGDNGQASLNSGGLYDPATNTWATLSTTGAVARTRHTAVWTGTKMIVFGGINLATVTALPSASTGQAYDPATNTWQTISTVGAPATISDGSAVWTGSKMIVWGGGTNEGGIYDPATNTWSTVTTVGAPSKRNSHTAVWTGTKMIVFGGYGTVNGAGASLNDGGIYDPATNTWSPLSTVGAPSVRYYHTAVWTGAKMIVFGGFATNIGYRNDGAIYDPATNTWQALPTANAPTNRFFHTAEWTGSQMIIFGGSDGSSLKTGAIYDPATNSWQAISTTSAPSGILYRSHVWTGSQMIVFGGTQPAGSQSAVSVFQGGVFQ